MDRADGPKWQEIYDIAESQSGYVARDQVMAAGYSSPLLEYHVRVGHLIRVQRGVYRLAQFPPGEHEDLVVTWLWSRRLGVFSHETALMLHLLSDALPAQAHLILPMGWAKRRVRFPTGVSVSFGDISKQEWAWVGAIPVTTPLRTIVDCVAAHVEPLLIQQAKREGLTRGLFSREQLTLALKHHAK